MYVIERAKIRLTRRERQYSSSPPLPGTSTTCIPLSSARSLRAPHRMGAASNIWRVPCILYCTVLSSLYTLCPPSHVWSHRSPWRAKKQHSTVVMCITYFTFATESLPVNLPVNLNQAALVKLSEAMKCNKSVELNGWRLHLREGYYARASSLPWRQVAAGRRYKSWRWRLTSLLIWIPANPCLSRRPSTCQHSSFKVRTSVLWAFQWQEMRLLTITLKRGLLWRK